MSDKRKLFGGAITIDLPSNLVDVSAIREVPDTQEVFISPSSEASYVIEILQRVDPSDPKDAARFHFDALADDNQATTSSITNIDVPGPPLPIGEDALVASIDKDSKSNLDSEREGEAVQQSSKEPETSSKTDELSTPSPIFLHGQQTVKKFNRTVPDEVQIMLALYRIEGKSVDLVFTANLPVATEAGDGMSEDQLKEAKDAFITAAHSLRIDDFGLFV
ncbi:Mog1p/PsbP-like protein [Schizopora paradoxa]|uniref:Mog1p/PsbP-like protein n=1 Tax=Schizopora paradoxa TaxID=27342 RepID=A0A0H2R857_9AGAM|nr:Mog1p/PsbP-like protein [Schizopora paradoxa]